jgi:cytidylate kinase
VVAKDAEVIDSSNLSIDQVVDEIVKRLRTKGFSGLATE